ncbi:hypothetical protein JHS3_17570 [Jeongeupia sp. HS-3]|uniref:hypothetical protein n=1 Tax=Jeongeupia sp. HS-3 TaxID=1009682 RepID=UPI0018A4751F|nr:hypothetical protein [Jeongeupia sp. HS-3]BCL76021.1 hypothetical protein JHS3_17570 [Jeongeupia sp. HS-3]
MDANRMMWWLLLLAGIAVGPGWYIYARHFSGQLLSSQPLQQTPAPQTLSLAVRGDQSPLGIVLKGDIGGRRFGPETRAEFVVDARLNGVLLSQETVTFVDAKTSSDAVPDRTPTQMGLAPLALEHGGTLAVTVTAVGAQTLTVHELALDVRGNVRHSPPHWLFGGALLALGAAVMLILGSRR